MVYPYNGILPRNIKDWTIEYNNRMALKNIMLSKKTPDIKKYALFPFM